MKSASLLILIFCSFYFKVPNLNAQGCSDAGFCTIHSIKPQLEDSTFTSNNTFKLGTAYGVAQYNVLVITPYLEYTRRHGKLGFSAKLLMGVRSGELTTTSGLADIILSTSWQTSPKLQLSGAIKLPFNKADKTANGLPLPMAYQTSLGTTDLILGASFKINEWLVSTAWQQPLNQNNNAFLFDDYPDGELNDPYLSTNGYKRKGDVLVRISRSAILSEKMTLSYSLLPIYHLGNDSYLNSNGEELSIYKSKGLTLNLNAFVQYQLNESSALEFNVGAPIMARKNRPDGLSQFAVALEYIVSF